MEASTPAARTIASVQTMQAERYELQVDHESSAQAKQLLAEMPAA